VALKEIVEQTVAGLGYELVEIQRSTAGLLRVTIDLPWSAASGAGSPPPGAEQFVTVEDCEKVTRQLLFALEVEGIDFKRLEVSSPGIDRPLRSEKDFERFAGQVIDVTLREPVGTLVADGQVSASRKKFQGRLERRQAEGDQEATPGWQIVWTDAPSVKPGQRVSKKRLPAPTRALGFTLDELREARLAPIVSFKGRASGGSTESNTD
jgi:ribosome maturation factor RimP